MLFLKSKERRCLGLTSLLSVLAGVDVLIGDDVGLYLWSGRRIAALTLDWIETVTCSWGGKTYLGKIGYLVATSMDKKG